MGLQHPKAGWGDCGFHNRWCMEFTHAIPFTYHKDMRVGQIAFMQTLESTANYTEDTGNYQLEKEWQKEDILPKAGNY
jgi:deoxycytidine triphosphate deaminase